MATGYFLGRTLGRLWSPLSFPKKAAFVLAAIFAVYVPIAVVMILRLPPRLQESGSTHQMDPAMLEKAKAAMRARAAVLQAELLQRCTADLAAVVTLAKADLSADQPGDAVEKLKLCEGVMTDRSAIALLAQARQSEQRIETAERVAALRRYQNQQAQEKARKKRQGVSIGMSQQDVLDSSWGRPEHINKTHNASGTREQWVYPGHRSYLYFENGVLTTVQN